MANNKITPKQQRFVDEYQKDWNATAAAGRAGYSDPNFGRQLITKPNVAEAIGKARATISRHAGITAEEIVEDLKTVRTRCMSTDLWDSKGACKALELLGKAVGLFGPTGRKDDPICTRNENTHAVIDNDERARIMRERMLKEMDDGPA